MRDILVSVEGYPGCCKIDVIFNFECLLGDVPLTSDEWFYTLVDNGVASGFSGPMYTFAHSEEENSGPCTPKKLALWLRRRKERVRTTSWEHIIMYTWIPSDKFWTDIQNYKDKKNKKEDGKRGGFDSY